MNWLKKYKNFYIVRVLKYTAPSWPNPNTTATASEVTVVKV